MNKETLIKNKITFIEETIKSAKKKNGRKKVLHTVGGCFFSGLGITLAFANPLMALATAAPTILFYLARKDSEESTNNLIENLEKEKKHLESIHTRELNGSKELNQKRKRKINELREVRKSVRSKKVTMEISAAIWGTLAIVGSVATLSSVIGVFYSVVGVVALMEAAQSAMKNRKKEYRLDTRINNIQNDLDIINAEKKSKQSKKKSQVKEMKPREKSKTKSNDKSYIPVQVYTDDATKQNEEAIDKYIYGLENQKQLEKPKYRVKY